MKKSEKKSISYMIKRHVTKEMKYNKLYMDIAKRVSEMSYAERLHVGAVVVKDGRIISMGWNGMPTGWDNNCERQQYNSDDPNDDTMETKKEVLHAESNAISKLARSTESGQGAAMYITHMPCLECAKLIHQSGIETVYYGQKYRDDAGLHFLQRSKVAASMIGD
jgi:dCMP deaminase